MSILDLNQTFSTVVFLVEDENVAYPFKKQVKKLTFFEYQPLSRNWKDLLIRKKWRLELRTTMTILTQIVAYQSGAAGRTLQLNTGETVLL